MTNRMPAQRPEHEQHREMRDEQGKITCVICQAAYSPSQWYMHLLQGPPIALESAFMSMCHFCFRCRRPACPECWDDVNGVCGQCAQEARLPFRGPVKPFTGLLFVPSLTRVEQRKRQRHNVAPLVCVRHGRFLVAPEYAEDTADIPTWPLGAREQTAPPPRHLEEPSRALADLPTRPKRKRPRMEPVAGPFDQDSVRARSKKTFSVADIKTQPGVADIKTQPGKRKRRRMVRWLER
ncbi:MAG: hypothetical protein J2P36_29960, partial [Ktedonobacteraceae bacterium]|nr:hypothetical protein [Ktedonobacteraceae bacterium]